MSEDVFSYAVWPANTSITLANVPWDNSYRDVVNFNQGQKGLNEYLDTLESPSLHVDNATYAKFGHPIDLDVPFNTALKYNYLRASNRAQPINGDVDRSFYYFVVGVEYVAPQTTRFLVQLDIWQSFFADVQIGNAYLERGHIGIANNRGFEEFGRDYLTIPEGLDMGGEYVINRMWSKNIASSRDMGGNSTYVMIISTVSLDAPFGNADAPEFHTAKGSELQNIPSGAEIYFCTKDNFVALMAALSDNPWVTQGFMSVTLIPNPITWEIPLTSFRVEGVGLLKPGAGSASRRPRTLAANWRNEVLAGLPPKYRHLKKFLTFPYCAIELTTNTGTPVILKPELMFGHNMDVVETAYFGAPSPRMVFYPYQYNGGRVAPVTDAKGVVHDGGEFTDVSTMITNFPQLPVVNDGYLNYMATQKNSIAFQQGAADWAQQKALAAAGTSYDQATASMGLNQDLTGQQIGAASQQTALSNEMAGLNALRSGVGSLAGGAMGGPAGLAMGAVGAVGAIAGMAMQQHQNNQALSINTGLMAGVSGSTVGNMGYVRDTNNQLANFAANGDYETTIAGIQAKVQDAKMIQPTTSGQVGGDAYLLANYQWGYDAKVKMLDDEAMATVGDFWLRFGYAIGRFIPQDRIPKDLRCMSRFTYWKMREVYMTGTFCPENFKQAIRGILEKGVTVWTNPADIGRTPLWDNEPLEGIYY